MMSAQAGTGSGGTPVRPGGWSPGGGDRETRRSPGLWTAVLAFGLLVAMTAGSVMFLRGRGGTAGSASGAGAGSGTDWGADTEATAVERKEGDKIDATMVMGQRRYDAGTAEFRTADAVAIMGHTVLDLRNARVIGDRAVIDAVAIMGHVEILVPRDWEVRTGDMLTAGAVRNVARRSEAESPVRVRIDGVVFAGRLDVRH